MITEGVRCDGRSHIAISFRSGRLKQDGNAFIVLTNHLIQGEHFVPPVSSLCLLLSPVSPFGVSSLCHPSFIYYSPSSFHLLVFMYLL